MGASLFLQSMADAKARNGAMVPAVGGANSHTEGGGTNGRRRRTTFSELIADLTRGVDGEGNNTGAPAGQQKTKIKVGGDPVTKTFDHFVKAEGIDKKHGLVFGWAMVCKEDGVDYWDVQENHIPEDSMLEALTDFAEGARVAKEMHTGEPQAQYLFLFPLTADIAKAFGITTKRTGAIIGYKPPPDVLARFESGELSGFSIGGRHINLEDV